MTVQPFALKPFPDGKPVPAIALTGTIARSNQVLTLRYQLGGDWPAIALPFLTDEPARRDNLWQETCFECFLGLSRTDRYWEFNLSPAGHWNVYRFVGYRQGMQVETAWCTLPFTVSTNAQGVSLSLDCYLDAIVATHQMLDVSITAVVKTSMGELSYWALTHTGREADFHRRDSFILTI